MTCNNKSFVKISWLCPVCKHNNEWMYSVETMEHLKNITIETVLAECSNCSNHSTIQNASVVFTKEGIVHLLETE